MKIEIGNKVKISDYSKTIIQYVKNNLVIDNPEYFIAQKMGRYTGNIEKQIALYERHGEKLVLPFGTFGDILQIAKNEKIDFKNDIISDFAPVQPIKLKGEITLYDYQEKAVNIIHNKTYGILEAPCGSGKTQMGIALINKISQKALWLTHTKDLLTQSMERTKQYFDGDFGTITDGKINIGRDITFATIQTMTKIDLDSIKDQFNVIIVDECHRAAGSPTKVMQFYKVLSSLKARWKYGLSATLSRSDGMIKSTFALLGPIKHSIDQSAVGDKIIKAKYEEIFLNTEESDTYLDFDGTINYSSLMEYLSNDDQRNKKIVENIANSRPDSQLVLSTRVEHLKTIQNELKKLNIDSVVLHSKINKQDREMILERMKKGENKILIATFTLAKEGLDIPRLTILHLTQPSKNKAIIEQSVGRIERNIEGKSKPTVYDYIDQKIDYCYSAYKKRKGLLNNV